MWFSLFVVVLILAITFYQGLLGAFTATINFFLTVLAAALAFGLYESVYFEFLLDRQPDDGRGIALMAIFIVSLLVMRVIVDLLIKDNMHFPVHVDRAVGGVFGFFTAMIIIGMLTVGIQMLPFPHQWLGFSRYAMFDADTGEPISLTPEEDSDRTERDILATLDMSKVNLVRRNIWLNPDGFTVALVSHLSDNALAGENQFGRLNPTFLDDLFWTRFSQTGQRTTVARSREAIRVEGCWVLPEDALYVAERTDNGKTISFSPPSGNEHKPETGHRYLMVRANITSDGADDGSTYRVNTGQVRLFTRDSGRVAVYHLAGVNEPNVVSPESWKQDFYYRLSPGESVVRSVNKFDFVFEVPEGEEPWFIEFRRNARAIVQGVQEGTAPHSFAPPAAVDLYKRRSGNAKAESTRDNGGSTQQPAPRPRREINRHTDAGRAGDEARGGGRTRRYSSDLVGSFFSDELPFELTDYTANSIDTRSGRVIGGQGYLTAKLDENDEPIPGRRPALKTFDVPSNMRLLQLSVRRLHPHSTLAQAMDFARQLGTVHVEDEQGRSYPAVGTWGIATVGGERVFELVYYDETTRIGSSAPPKLDIIRRGQMTSDYALYYLFHIPPGKRIVRFLVPRSNGEDLTAANLVAPD